MKRIWKCWYILMISALLYGWMTPHAFSKKQFNLGHDRYPLIGNRTLSNEINRFINMTDPNLSIGVHIKSMKYGDMIYTKNNQRLFIPASILKVFTAESALLLLGPNYKFSTQLVTDAKRISRGVLEGNLYLVNSGDPSLTNEDLVQLISSLKLLKIQQIQGNVYIDNTAYDQEQYGPGWIWNDKRFCYAAPISASIINHNCLTFRIAPGKITGRLANIVDNQHYFYSSIIQNHVITRPHTARSCYIRLGSGINNALIVDGCLPKGRYTQSISAVVNDIMRYNKLLLANLLKQFKIKINGNIGSGTAPARYAVLTTHQSKPLSVLITDMLKMSDNIIAGSIFKKLGATYSKQPGSWENGSTAVTQVLAKKMGVGTSGMSIIDGSGLSRYNLITPAQMIQVLDFAYHHEGSNDNFIAALPVAGVDGTLKHRLYNVAWKVRAKTGTMAGVVALAGYAMNRDNELLAFVIMVNGQNGLGWKYRALEDTIVTALTRYSRQG